MPLTYETRIAVVEYAKQFLDTPHDQLDCSHFVWNVFKRFFPAFPYMPSGSYLTSPVFRQVASPQPADLVVWDGHVAIMVNPAVGSFIGSQTSTGVNITSFQNEYWRQRPPLGYLTIA
jgi:cell wall-associated NlpC family hydrolase